MDKVEISPAKKLTLSEFIEEQKQLLQQFTVYWIKMNSEQPEQFPMELFAGDWDEQFWCFDEE